MRLILASQSPRRRDFLQRAGFQFDVLPADVDETPLHGESAASLVRRLALTKGRAILAALTDDQTAVVLSADTTVWLSPTSVLEKPRDNEDAVRMLSALSGRAHYVSTGWAIMNEEHEHARVHTALVEFRPLSKSEIRAYVATGEPADKAGAYGIQGGAASFVTRIHGSWASIAGLPIADIVPALHEFGIHPTSA
jgi:septum formation protein